MRPLTAGSSERGGQVLLLPRHIISLELMPISLAF